jgi:FdhE protein
MTVGSTQTKILSPEEIAVRAGEQLTFLHLPDAGVFAARALRLRELAAGHAMRDFLLFAAELAEAQHRALSAGAEVPLPTAEQIDAAAREGLPLLPALSWPRAAVWRESLRALLADLARRLPDSPAKATALQLATASDEHLEMQAARLLGGVMRGLDLASAPLIAAGLQLHWVRLVQQTAARAAGPVAAFGRIDDPTVCPCCGSAPVASIERLGSEGARYLACGLCATQWHYVRVKCAHCQSTKGISLQSLVAADDGAATTTDAVVQAECCSECGRYLKLIHPARDPGAEPLADDLASLTLDLLVSSPENSGGLQRHGINLLLLFGEPDESPPPGKEH